MATRKPASVLPEPVGAAISVSTPGGDERPALRLRLGGALGEAAPEPRAHGRMEAGEAARRRTRLRWLGAVTALVISSTTPPILARGCDS